MGKKAAVHPGDIFMIPLYLPSKDDDYTLDYSKYKFPLNDIYAFGRLIEIQAGNVDLIEVFSYTGQIPENPDIIIQSGRMFSPAHIGHPFSKKGRWRAVFNNPCYDMWSDGSIPEWSILPNEYARFVRTFFDIMFENQSLSKIDVEPILSIIKSIEGIENSFCNFCDKKCNHFLSVYPGGKVIGCDNFSLEDGMYLDLYAGETIHDFLTGKPQPLFSQLDTLLEKCGSCSYRLICHGGCLAVRRRYTLYGINHEAEQYCREMQGTIEYIRKRIESVRNLHEDS